MVIAKALELEYRYRVNHVVNYMEEHLTDPLTLKEVSDVGAFSPFHFHRVFKAVMGENVHGFTRRIRIEKAIKLLLFHPNRSITDIALDCGLQTPAHFLQSVPRAYRPECFRMPGQVSSPDDCGTVQGPVHL
ncbi:helix-turn-helix transcriptional regulator [Paenibacillus rhizoplanae]